MTMKEELFFKEQENLAELVGIILGNGKISRDRHTLTIILNVGEEYQYIEYVKNLINTLFNFQQFL